MTETQIPPLDSLMRWKVYYLLMLFRKGKGAVYFIQLSVVPEDIRLSSYKLIPL